LENGSSGPPVFATSPATSAGDTRDV
jgi:hypothetical protein